MKLKKSLLALSTAAAVTVAGIPAATAAEQTADSSLGKVVEGLNSSNKPAKDETETEAPADETETEAPADETETEAPAEGTDASAEEGFMGSVDNFFGWEEDASPLDKIKSVGTLLSAIVAIISGITGLAGAIEKLGKIGR